MPRTREQIIELVDAQADRRRALHKRMDDDYNLFLLKPYTGEGAENEDGGNDLAGFKKYTSNEPRTYADKIISIASDAQLQISVQHGKKAREERDVNNDKERFARGVLNAANERLRALAQPNIQDQLVWGGALRGIQVGRAVFVKEPDGTTTADITPWDARHTYWGMGRNGLAWACLRLLKTRQEIEAEYGVTLEPREAPNGLDEKEPDIPVYDYYDTEINTTVIEERVLKSPTRHGAKRVPVFLGIVGPTPPIQMDNQDPIIDYGESIFHAVRGIINNHNYNMTIMLNLVARSLKQPIVITSPDGRKVLAANPWLSGSEISLGKDDKVETLDMQDAAKETGAFMGLVLAEWQRGALAHSTFGELEFQLSGFAINSLRQNIVTVLRPLLNATIGVWHQIFDMLADQYVAGGFQAMTLSGRDRNREYFNEEITPDVVKEGGNFEIDLLPSLPQDEPAKFAMAQQAKQGGFMGNRDILETILQVPDPDIVIDAQKLEVAEQASPMAAAFALMRATENQGEEQIAAIYSGELQIQMKQKELELLQLQMAAVGLAQNPGGQNGRPTNGHSPDGAGLPPTVLPSVAQGNPPPTPTPQAGPNVPPNTPRPGALTDRDRLAILGLIGS